MKPGPTCYPPTFLPGVPKVSITNMVVPEGYHCFAFTSTEDCEGNCQDFIGGSSPSPLLVIQDFFTSSCLKLGQFPPKALTTRAQTTDIPGMNVADACDNVPTVERKYPYSLPLPRLYFVLQDSIPQISLLLIQSYTINKGYYKSKSKT